MVDAVQHAGGDNFVVGGQQMSLATLIMFVNMQRAELMDKQMGDQLSAMKERNDRLQTLIQWIQLPSTPTLAVGGQMGLFYCHQKTAKPSSTK